MDGLINRVASEWPLLFVVALAALILAVPLILWRVRTGAQLRTAAWKTAVEVGALGSIAVIAAVTLATFGGGGAGEINWVPFRSLIESMALGDFWVGLVVVDLVGNLLLVVPLGLFVGLRFPRLRARLWAAGTVTVSALVELAQGVLLNRSADVTDVIMNTTGALLGFALARTVQRMAGGEATGPAASH